MQMRGVNFGFNGVTRAAGSKSRSRGSAAAVGIAALHHEVLDDPVKEQIVIEPLFDELDEVVPVRRGVVKQLDGHGAKLRFQCHLRRSTLSSGRG